MMQRGGRARWRSQEPTAPAGEEPPRHRLAREDIGAFRRLLHYVRPYTRRMLAATISLLIATLLGLVFPWIVRSLVDSVFVHHDEQALNRIAAGLIVIFVVQAI